MAGQVLLGIQGAVAWVTLSHPGKFNAMDCGMWRVLRQVFEDIQTAAQLRCVVVRGAEGHFCAGGDISEYPTFRFDPQSLAHFHEELVWGGLAAMLACDVPILAQIEGNCMGAGLEIASCCDLRLSHADARFGAPIARLGFPMAPREAELVSRAVGDATARAMLLAAQVMDAPALHSSGFLLEVVTQSHDQLTAKVQALSAHISSLAPQAARLNKQTFRILNSPQAQVASWPVAINNEANGSNGTATGAYTYAGSAEHREGIAAFLEKRKPNF